MKKRYTALLYRQHKYNLFKEETEGFAKLLVLFATAADTTTSDASSSSNSAGDNAGSLGVVSAEEAVATAALRRKARMLMGYFDLDPNRTLDLLLGALEVRPAATPLLRFLASDFAPRAVPQLLGWKFVHYRREIVRQRLMSAAAAAIAATADNKSAAASTEEAALAAVAGGDVTPSSLYRLAVLCLGSGMVELNALLAHLEPPLEALREHQKRVDKLIEAVSDRTLILCSGSISEVISRYLEVDAFTSTSGLDMQHARRAAHAPAQQHEGDISDLVLSTACLLCSIAVGAALQLCVRLCAFHCVRSSASIMPTFYGDWPPRQLQFVVNCAFQVCNATTQVSRLYRSVVVAYTSSLPTSCIA